MELKYHKFTLPNGIRVFMVPKKESRAVLVEVAFGVGSRYEDKENEGIAHFMEHMVFKGTKKRPTSLDITKNIDQVGGLWNAFTASEVTGYHIQLQSEKIELAFDILSDMIINSKIDEKELKKEKGVILEEYKMKLDNPDIFAAIKFNELAYGDTPLGRFGIGTNETIKSMDRKKIIDFSRKFYNPDNMVIAIGGNINQEKTKKLLKKYFGKIKGETKEKFEKNNIIQKSPLIQIHKKDNKQAIVMMGFRSFGRGNKKRYIREIILKALGGYMSSRLHIDVREKKGLAYAIYSWIDVFQEVGFLGIVGGFDPKKVSEALKEIFKILRGIKKNGFAPSEVNMAKENSVGRLILSLEGAGGWAEDIAINDLFGLPIETPDEIIKKTNKVTNADIKRLAREIFRPENFNMVIVGPIESKEEKKYLDLVKL